MTDEVLQPERRVAVWLAGAGVLVMALVFLPSAIAAWSTGAQVSVATLPDVVAAGFSQWVRSGSSSHSGLADAVSFWAVFHVVKAIVAAALLVAVLPVGMRIWAAYVHAPTRSRRILLLTAGVLGAPAPPVLVLMVMANVQGAAAPLSSVLTFLPMTGASVAQVRGELAAGTMTPMLTALVDDFRLYHAVLVGTAVVAIVAVVVATVVVWIRRARTSPTDRRLRRVLAAAGTALPVLVLFLGVVLLANVSTVADTAPALASFFDGSGM
ncbi:hypothetical protein ACLBWP_11030 [Microbacterium sp. M1A1_1b]